MRWTAPRRGPCSSDARGTPAAAGPPAAPLSRLRCEFAQACAHARVVRSNAAVADRTAVRPEHRTRPPLAHLEHAIQVSDSLALGSGRHHFFAAMSLSMALSSIASAKSFLSLVFSSSSAFNRLASDTSRPPYFAFHL